MDLQYLSSKNNQKTFTVNSIFYHSSYNPQREAERFISAYSFQNTKPDLIILVEPGFSYLYSILKEKFPESKIGILRLLKDFNESSSPWDFIIENKRISDYLISKFNESVLLNSEVIIWPQAENLFREQIIDFYNEYKKALNYGKTILTTRQYFEKKWLINSINILKYGNNFCKINIIDTPVVITASGPSLKSSLPVIKKLRNKFFLICLSSALPVLLNEKIIPDLCMSTDGGYYAKEHLKKLNKYNIPLALGSEAACSKNILKNIPIILLNYSDGISSKLIDKTNIVCMKGERNGTVSGTAYKFARNITSKEIFFCGLDLSFAKGFQHTQPNELEFNNSLSDYKLRSKEKRIASGEMNKTSLDIYKNWFASLSDTNSLYRVIDKSLNKLGNINDITCDNFELKLKELKERNKINYISSCISKNSIENIIKSFFDNIEQDELLEQLFPIDYLSISHSKTPDEKEKLIKNLNKKKVSFENKIWKILQC